jgi:adenylylsulfate kinase-like enzyme
MSGEIKEFTGVSSLYEAPQNPQIVLETDLQSVEESVVCIVDKLKMGGILKP